MNTPEHLNITQWVIDNRYPKDELNKISDFDAHTEMGMKLTLKDMQRLYRK